MHVYHSISSLRTKLQAEFQSGKKLGFVPTMGALHEGHLSLVQTSVSENDLTAVSIFVNPTQFAPGEDYGKYPKTLEADIEMVKSVGADVVFAPDVNEMYPFPESQVGVTVGSLGNRLCGSSRPTHFGGVMLVVSKLFNIVDPHRAYFGLKDYQQYVIIKRMAAELCFPVEVIGCPIVREEDGLAMSSRNIYLSEEERKKALLLSKTLKEIHQKVNAGETDVKRLKSQVEFRFTAEAGIKLDYFEVCDGESLEFLSHTSESKKPIALIAAFLGTTRLIDNRFLG